MTSPLFVLAGLPNPVDNRVVRELSQDPELPSARFVSIGAPRTGSALYTKKGVEQLLRGTGTFVVRRRSATEGKSVSELSPSRLILVYVPSDDQEALLAAFDFFALPIRMFERDQALTLRNNVQATVRTVSDIVRAVRSLSNADHQLLQEKLQFGTKRSPLLLPPRNYYLRDGDVHAAFRELRSSEGRWGQWCESIGPKKVDGEKGRVFSDDHGRVFPPDPKPHPPARFMEDEEPSVSNLRLALNGLFRFGFPTQEGFHYDVYKPGVMLDGERFYCASRGQEVTVSGKHVNVYPNDHIRE